MPRYKYTALTTAGKKIKGDLMASSRTDILSYLRTHALTPIQITENKAPEKLNIRNPFVRSGYRLKDMVFFTRQFATMLNAGLNVTSALDTLRRQKTSLHLKKSLDSLYEQTSMGMSLSQSLQKNKTSFPPFLMRMMEVGELSGNLDSIMTKLSDYYEREYDVSKKIKGALIYPTMILLVTIFMLIFILIFVLPSFENMFSANGASLPLITRILLSLSQSLMDHGLIYLLVLGLAGLGLRQFFHTEQGHETSSLLKLKLPVIRKHYQMIITSRFARTMQILLYSGITITYALEITANVMENAVLRRKVLTVRDLVNSGEPFGKSLDSIHFFPDILLSMIDIGETSGSLDEMLEKSSTHYDKEMENAINQLLKLIEPGAILLVSVLVGFAVFAILMPMLDMINLY